MAPSSKHFFTVPALSGSPRFCTAEVYTFPQVFQSKKQILTVDNASDPDPGADADADRPDAGLLLHRKVLVVTLRNEKALNALPLEAHRELSLIWQQFDSDDSLLVGIITGAGKRAFCAGFDLKQAASIPVSDKTGTEVANKDASSGELQLDVDSSKPLDSVGIRGGSGFGGLSDRRNRVKPIIAAVNGLAHGGGFEIVLSTDVVIAVSTADFALPEPLVGLAALAGGMVRLPRLVGYSNAMDIMLTGRRVSSAEALRLGIVQSVLPPGEDCLQAALALAERIMNASPEAIQATMEVARRSLYEHNDPVDAIVAQASYPTIQRLSASANRAEGTRAFAEKRLPAWKRPLSLPSKL